ncbi:PadR family transcriptional regulator [[Eubacterium] hominis]|uniref:PadR family transcriptional regulator n=1 Tax=[Eubacterium] hominis TaxID=2764325 RepID=UPI003A4DCCAE
MVFQLGSALLDACVLAILHKEDTYGYKLTQEVKEIVTVSESTLYPVLRRLTKDGYLCTYDKEYMGRNRRYYQLTSEGKAKYMEYVSEWKDFSEKIDGILQGGYEDESNG